MPPGWDGQDVLARYKHINIQLKEVKEIDNYQVLIAEYAEHV
jgi:hypothetical protein